MAAGHALHSYGLKLWYISSEAKDKCDTVIYAVNRTDQGMFSPPSASGTAELLYVARSSPTATSKQPKGGQPKEQHLREGSEETGRAVPKDAGIWALSWGRYSQDKVISFTLSPAFADFRRLCVKFSIFCHLKLKCTGWVLRPYYGKLFGVCFVADSLKFPFAASSCFLFRCASYKPREAAQMYQNGEKRGHSVPQ